MTTDQFIVYGWRSAEIENLANMKRGRTHSFLNPSFLRCGFPDFPGTQEILLEENYRSTGAILRLSLAIISEGQHTTSNPVKC